MDTSNIEIRLEDDLYEEEDNNDDRANSRSPEETVRDAQTPFSTLQKNEGTSSSCIGGLLRCCFGGAEDDAVFDKSPDDDFYADSLIELSHGYTAYRLLEPAQSNDSSTSPPLIILLHGMQNSSYMWADIAELLADFEQGPQAQVLVFDFYGRGRSPWTGVPISLDLLVGQVKELMDALGLAGKVAALVGYDLGGAVATGFAARYPHLCISLTLLSPIGVKYKSPLNEKSFQSKYFGEISMAKQKAQIPEMQEVDFFTVEADAAHRYLIDRQIAMSHWQIKNTPGYLGALLSTYRNFPIRNMDELFAAVGRHSRKVLVVWGNKDKVCPYSKCIATMEESFPNGTVVDILDCGHNCVFEKFEDVVTELLNFHRDVFVMGAKPKKQMK